MSVPAGSPVDRAAGTRSAWAGLALLTALLTCAAATTWFVLERLRDRLLPELLATPRPGVAELARLALAGMGPAQWALVALLLAFGIATILAEWRFRAISAWLTGPPALLLAGFVVILLWLGHSYLGSGVLLSGDTIAHVSMLATRVDAARRGQDPTWSNWTYLGLPLQAFYAPTTFWPLVRLALLANDPTVALRAFLFANHVLSGLAGYALARQLKLTRLGACFAAIVYAGAFAHLHLILYRGAIPQALSAVLFPLALLFLHRVATAPQTYLTRTYLTRTGLTRTGLWGGNWTALVVTTAGLLMNYTPLAIVAGVHMAVLAIFTLRRDGAVARLAALAAAAVAAAVMSAAVLLPAALAGSEVLPLSLGHLLTLAVPGAGYFDQLLVWRAWRTDYPGGAAYLGLVAVVFAGIGIFATIRRRTTWALTGLLGLSLVLSGLHVRDVMFTVLYIALLAGIGAEAVLAANDRASKGRFRLGPSAAAIVLLLFLIDLGSTSVQPVGRTDKGWMDAAGQYLAQRSPSGRTLSMEVSGEQVVASTGPSLLDWYPAEFVASGHVEMATPAWIYAEEAGYMVEADLRQGGTGRLQPDTLDLLCLLRVARVVGVGRVAMGLPASVPDTVQESPLGRVLMPACPHDVPFAPALAAPPEPPFNPVLDYATRYGASVLPTFRQHLDRILADMKFDAAQGSAARFLIPGLKDSLPASSDAPSAQAAPQNAVTTLSYVVGPARIDIALDAQRDGFVRLSHAWHSRVSVRLNGEIVPSWRDITGCIVVKVNRGQNNILIEPNIPWPDQVGFGVTIATLLLLLIMAAMRHVGCTPKHH